MPSGRNKTITLTNEESAAYASRALKDPQQLAALPFADRLFCGDMLTACPYIPQSSFDLLIADPPYNLHKKYGNSTFTHKSDSEYAAFTRRWIEVVLPL